jgi:hypothetical protein
VVTAADGRSRCCLVTTRPARFERRPAGDADAGEDHVESHHGGTAVADDFAQFIDGNPVSWGVPVPVSPGPHTASETPLAGYAASAWGGDCATGGTVTVALGESKTCTITNDDLPGTIIIQKVSAPANTGSFSFATTGSGYNNFILPGGGQNSQALSAGLYSAGVNTVG